jgi:hypothetical protein
MLIPLLLTALAVAPTPSPDGLDQDGVVTTAPAANPVLDGAESPVAPAVGGAAQSTGPHGLNTDQQIAQWLSARASEPANFGEAPVWRDDREMHGEVSVSVGTGGYRDYAAAVSLPIGEGGRLDISVSQSKNDPYRYGYGAGYDPWFADSGYALPGQAAPGAAIGYERQLSRPDGPPIRRSTLRRSQSAAE